MHTTREIEYCLQRTPAGLRDIVWELRSLIVSVAPTATEVVKRWGFSYYYARRGGPVSAGICQIGLFSDHIRLAFIHGAFLPDPRLAHVRWIRWIPLLSKATGIFHYIITSVTAGRISSPWPRTRPGPRRPERAPSAQPPQF